MIKCIRKTSNTNKKMKIMKKMFISLIIALMSLVITSCVTTRSTKKINSVELGMTKSEIRHMFGNPSYRNAWANGEQWGYHKQVGDIAGPESVLFVVAFDKDGKVVEFETKKDFPQRPFVAGQP